jgi:hypothetical protein
MSYYQRLALGEVIRNPTSFWLWNPESREWDPESREWDPESIGKNPESKVGDPKSRDGIRNSNTFWITSHGAKRRTRVRYLMMTKITF